MPFSSPPPNNCATGDACRDGGVDEPGAANIRGGRDAPKHGGDAAVRAASHHEEAHGFGHQRGRAPATRTSGATPPPRAERASRTRAALAPR